MWIIEVFKTTFDRIRDYLINVFTYWGDKKVIDAYAP
jgi:hypothetical protein